MASGNLNNFDCEEELKTEKRRFSQINMVDVVLSSEGQEALSKTENNAFEQVTDTILKKVFCI